MPLIRDHEQFECDGLQGIYFQMTDRVTRVLCKVSHEALRSMSVDDGINAGPAATFLRHRGRIEMIAGEKYDRGHRANDLIVVLSGDVTSDAI